MLITMLDRLRQGDPLWDNQAGTPALARQYPLAIGPLQDTAIAMPARASPAQGALVGALDRAAYGSLDQVLVQGTGAAGDDEATVSILYQATPAFSLVRLASCPLFFCTNDQNSSISTWLRCRSLASTCVRASAWAAARHAPGTDRFVLVPRDLFGRTQAASSHHDQQGVGHLPSLGLQPIHRRSLRFSKVGLAGAAAIPRPASMAPIAHDMRPRTVRIGT
jgi:hypothetical protein